MVRDLDRSRLRHNANQDGIKEALKTIFSSEDLRPPNPTTND